MKTLQSNKQVIFLILLSLVFSVPCFAATYYMPDDYANLQAAFPNMSSGDTLIIRDGTYSGAMNVIDHTHKPPNGTAGNFTTVKAENDGAVIIEGAKCDISAASYLKFQGIIWRRVSNSGRIYISSATRSFYIYFLRCGFYSDEAIDVRGRENAFCVNWAHHVLIEECYAWGNFRYGFYVGSTANDIVIRKCVARLDAYNTETGMAAFMLYDCKDTEVQNCIAIDIDNPTEYYDGQESIPNAFYFRKTASGYDVSNVNITGCIALNIASGQFIIGSAAASINFLNTVFWDGYNGIRSRYGGATFNHCVSGKISGTGTSSAGYYSESSKEPVINSIACNITSVGIKASGSYTLEDYNCLYGNGSNYSGVTIGANDFCLENSNAIDPLDGTPGNGIMALKYLVKIEDDSNLDGAAGDGEDIGAMILKKIGVTGTFYGDTGYNTVTSDDLWPFPNEDLIRTKMKEYSFNGVSGDRGFCADGQTLTKYIWEYLGNTIPPEIYGGETNNPPTVSITLPANGAEFTNGENIEITANASDSDGTVVKVEFYQNATKLGEDTTSPYSYTWENVPAGTYVLTARAIDDDNAATTSAPVNVSVNSEDVYASTFAECSPDLGNLIIGPSPYKPNDDDFTTGTKGEGIITFGNLTKDAEIEIYTINGQLLVKLIENDGDGKYVWRVPERIASGVYVCRITNSKGEKKFRKIMIIK